jgi:glutamyl/glutaminyl-tRNA synthetase
MKSDLQYSVRIVYNNFPWPEPVKKHTDAIAAAAADVLASREEHAGAKLEDLYDPVRMPPKLAKAHRTLDKAVERAFRRIAFGNDAERLSYLLERYATLVEPPSLAL